VVVVRPARLALGLGAAALAVVVACKPDLNQRTDEVTTPRVLAVRSDPAEAKPGDAVTLSALYVDARGVITDGPFDWAFCNERKPLAELGPVSPLCVKRAGDWFTELGGAPAVSAAMPGAACRFFGPEVPPPLANEPAGRPVDPDPTGGFYQPARFVAGDQIALLRLRIACDPSGISADAIAALKERYHVNVNPAVDAVIDATRGPLPFSSEDDGTTTTTVPPGTRLDLRATWADCDPTAKECTGSEGYPAYDVTTQTVLDRREEMRVSWFTTGGAFDEDTTGRPADDPTPFATNGWTAPSSPGTYRVWVVVRDDRGGSSWRALVVVVG
jgi:hypothetical protein